MNAKLPTSGLKIQRKKKGYSRGRDGYELILYAALHILIEEGYRAISFRKIAVLCDMNVGNVSYYFASKEDLIRALLNAIIEHYEEEFENITIDTKKDAKQQLSEIIAFIIQDLGSKKTTRVFPELWALSNHDPFVQRRVEALYRRARVVINDLIVEINPDLPAEEREVLALFISASMEGLTVFAGYKKDWNKFIPNLINIANYSFTNLVEHLKTTDIKADGTK